MFSTISMISWRFGYQQSRPTRGGAPGNCGKKFWIFFFADAELIRQFGGLLSDLLNAVSRAVRPGDAVA
jgi:hypothetical protein